jgi:xylan 1,4-beta-xylosidase
MPAEHFPVSLDLRQSAGAFPKFWNRCISSENAAYWLRRDMVEHHRLGREAFGHEYARFHGILSDGIGLAKRNKQGRIEHAWVNLEKVYDNVMDLGLKPFVEFSFMPSALAKGSKSLFYWKANVTMPKKLSEWDELIEAVTRRLLKRYGRQEVRKWYFEVWNEPNLPKWFFDGDMKDYFKLYDGAARAVRKVDPHFRVGGPASACAAWVEEFILHCKAKSVPADFVSYHLYPSDPFFMENEGMDFKWKGEPFFRSHVQRNAAILRRHADMGLEVHMTEWNVSSNHRDPLHDGPGAAAFAVKAVQEVAGLVDSFSWWTLSDLYEEGGLAPAPFHGGFGLYSIDGLKKASYFAFEALKNLGEELLARPLHTPDHSSGVIPTKGWDHSARLLFWSFQTPKAPKIKDKRVELKLGGLPLGRGKALMERWIIDAKHSNIVSRWQAMGQPDGFTPDELARLKRDNVMELAESKTLAVKQGEAQHRFLLKPDSVSYIVIR